MPRPKSIKNYSEDEVIDYAIELLENRIKLQVSEKTNEYLTSSRAVKKFLYMKLSNLEHEVFVVLFCDTHHRLIRYEEMFRGSIDGASVHPREIVKAALKHNARAVIIAHNHPAGSVGPSEADKDITGTLREILEIVDVELLDHIIVCHRSEDMFSFAEKGLI